MMDDCNNERRNLADIVAGGPILRVRQSRSVEQLTASVLEILGIENASNLGTFDVFQLVKS